MDEHAIPERDAPRHKTGAQIAAELAHEEQRLRLRRRELRDETATLRAELAVRHERLAAADAAREEASGQLALVVEARRRLRRGMPEDARP